MPLTLDILTQEKHLLTAEVDQVIVPAVNGEVTILPHHIPLFTKLNPGIVRFTYQDRPEEIVVFGGFMDVAQNRVTILADSAVRATDINEAKAEQARQDAQRAIDNRQSEIEFRQAQVALQRALLELKVARRRKQSTSLPQS